MTASSKLSRYACPSRLQEWLDEPNTMISSAVYALCFKVVELKINDFGFHQALHKLSTLACAETIHYDQVSECDATTLFSLLDKNLFLEIYTSIDILEGVAIIFCNAGITPDTLYKLQNRVAQLRDAVRMVEIRAGDLQGNSFPFLRLPPELRFLVADSSENDHFGTFRLIDPDDGTLKVKGVVEAWYIARDIFGSVRAAITVIQHTLDDEDVDELGKKLRKFNLDGNTAVGKAEEPKMSEKFKLMTYRWRRWVFSTFHLELFW